jgi:uncharacterized protein
MPAAFPRVCVRATSGKVGVVAALFVFCTVVPAKGASIALISIIIDDLGNNLQLGRRTIRLPGPVACAILPHTPFGAPLAQEAYENNKEIILHLPMQSADETEPGPGSLHSRMGAAEIATTLDDDLRTVPYAAGVSNHMGSLLTQRSEPMRWLMQALARRGSLFFVDSRTTADTVAAKTARELGVPNLERNVFLDDDRTIDAITQQFERLIALARKHGSALAVGHPYPETLELLERRLPELQRTSVMLVAPSVLLKHQEESPQQSSAINHPKQNRAPTQPVGEERMY